MDKVCSGSVPLRSFVQWHGVVPFQQHSFQVIDFFRVSFCQIVCFTGIFCQIVQFCLRPVILTEQFPMVMPYSEIWQVFHSVKGISVGGASKEKRLDS